MNPHHMFGMVISSPDFIRFIGVKVVEAEQYAPDVA